MASSATLTAQSAAINNIMQINNEFQIRSDPAAYQQSLTSTLDQIQFKAINDKRNAFAKTHKDLSRHFDMEHNAMDYNVRNQDLVKMGNYNLQQSRAAAQNFQHDKDLTRRQAEINDWYYQDKLETLFFLQMFFMTMLSMCIVMYFQKSGLISGSFASFLTFVLLTVIMIIGLYRYKYTETFRDPRWWYKRRFGKVDHPVFDPTPDPKSCAADPNADPMLPPKPAPGSPCSAASAAEAAKKAGPGGQGPACASYDPSKSAAIAMGALLSDQDNQMASSQQGILDQVNGDIQKAEDLAVAGAQQVASGVSNYYDKCGVKISPPTSKTCTNPNIPPKPVDPGFNFTNPNINDVFRFV